MYLTTIDKTMEKLNDFKCKCNICNSFYLDKKSDYKDNEDYNPVFYYCMDCNMNLHDNCLYDVMKNHRGKIQQCIFCNSNKIKCIKLSTAEYKYIIYNKILDNFDFNISSLE